MDKQPYHTALFEAEGGLERKDVCTRCWEKESAETVRGKAGFISHWQGVYEAPPPPDVDPIQKENAESLLRKLIEIDDPKYIPAGYILAVMLERKRILRVKEELQREGQRVFVYEQQKTGDVFTILDPDLQLDQLEAVQREVALLMERGIQAPVEEEQTPAVEDPVEPQVPGEEQATPSGITTP